MLTCSWSFGNQGKEQKKYCRVSTTIANTTRTSVTIIVKIVYSEAWTLLISLLYNHTFIKRTVQAFCLVSCSLFNQVPSPLFLILASSSNLLRYSFNVLSLFVTTFPFTCFFFPCSCTIFPQPVIPLTHTILILPASFSPNFLPKVWCQLPSLSFISLFTFLLTHRLLPIQVIIFSSLTYPFFLWFLLSHFSPFYAVVSHPSFTHYSTHALDPTLIKYTFLQLLHTNFPLYKFISSCVKYPFLPSLALFFPLHAPHSPAHTNSTDPLILFQLTPSLTHSHTFHSPPPLSLLNWRACKNVPRTWWTLAGLYNLMTRTTLLPLPLTQEILFFYIEFSSYTLFHFFFLSKVAPKCLKIGQSCIKKMFSVKFPPPPPPSPPLLPFLLILLLIVLFPLLLPLFLSTRCGLINMKLRLAEGEGDRTNDFVLDFSFTMWQARSFSRSFFINFFLSSLLRSLSACLWVTFSILQSPPVFISELVFIKIGVQWKLITQPFLP